MASRFLLLLLASFLLLTTTVSSNGEDFNMEAKKAKFPTRVELFPAAQIHYTIDPIIIPPPPAKAPVVVAPSPPVKAPVVVAPSPPVKAPVVAPSPPAKAPGVALPPPQVPIKPPTPAPVVKPPTIKPRPPIRTKTDCISQCGQRCSLHSRPRLCARVCVTCCDRCKCVPPGTYGSGQVCGTCWTGMTTRGNKPKCP